MELAPEQAATHGRVNVNQLPFMWRMAKGTAPGLHKRFEVEPITNGKLDGNWILALYQVLPFVISSGFRKTVCPGSSHQVLRHLTRTFEHVLSPQAPGLGRTSCWFCSSSGRVPGLAGMPRLIVLSFWAGRAVENFPEGGERWGEGSLFMAGGVFFLGVGGRILGVLFFPRARARLVARAGGLREALRTCGTSPAAKRWPTPTPSNPSWRRSSAWRRGFEKFRSEKWPGPPGVGGGGEASGGFSSGGRVGEGVFFLWAPWGSMRLRGIFKSCNRCIKGEKHTQLRKKETLPAFVEHGT